MEVWASCPLLPHRLDRPLREGQDHLLLLLRSGAHRLPEEKVWLVRSGRGVATLLPGDSPLLQGHATDRPWQKEQLWVSGEGGGVGQVPPSHRHRLQQAQSHQEAHPAALQEVRGPRRRPVYVQVLWNTEEHLPVWPGEIQLRSRGKKVLILRPFKSSWGERRRAIFCTHS